MPIENNPYTGYFGEKIRVTSEHQIDKEKLVVSGLGKCDAPWMSFRDAQQDFLVEFTVSLRTGLKDGYYKIFPRFGKCAKNPVQMECEYKNGLLHGEETWYTTYGTIACKRYWLHGREVEPFLTREKLVAEAKKVRKLFSAHAPLFEGIPSPQVVAIKFAFTRDTIHHTLSSRQK